MADLFIHFSLSKFIYVGFGLCIPVICLLPLFYFHMLGAGDIKLLAVTGAFLGWKSLVVCFMGALFVGGIISVYKMCRYHIFQKRFAYFSHYMKMYLKTGCVKPYYDSSLEAGAKVHFSVAVTIAVVLYLIIVNAAK